MVYVYYANQGLIPAEVLQIFDLSEVIRNLTLDSH